MNEQMRGICIALGLLRVGGFEDAAHWLHQKMTEPASDELLEALQQINEEVAQLNELPPIPLD